MPALGILFHATASKLIFGNHEADRPARDVNLDPVAILNQANSAALSRFRRHMAD